MSQPSVQLYSVRNAVDEDLQGAVSRLAEIGFTKVEPYGFLDRADEFAAALKTAGLTAPSGHLPVIDSADAEKEFAAAATLGLETLIDPFIPSDRWQTADDAYKIADRVNELAALGKSLGIKFGYHNHQWEFANKVDGRPIYELFVERLSDDVVLELDTFWATVGGVSAPEVLKSLGERVVAIHVKDGLITEDITNVLPSSESALVVPEALAAAFKNQKPAGQGDVDVVAILAAAPNALRVVEFDDYAADVFDGIAESFAWLAENDK